MSSIFNLFSNAYVVEMEFPAGGTTLDKALVTVCASGGFFFGQRWTSAAVKAVAAKVRRKVAGFRSFKQNQVEE